MNISEVSRRSGLAASTLRFYDEKGLIQSIGRHAQQRVFGEEVLDRLALIALGRAAGFSLQEIGTMLQADGARPRVDRGMLRAKADELDRNIRQLKAVRDGLRHAAECPESSHLDCPVFRRLMQAASVGEFAALPAMVARRD
ncbi:helix-turn-helix domain-containing protein [Diaphorobacter sp. HDW4A]|uniref:helix-turn-helix domain-containing protein n=1 Tax=Diaphorobacter sp. HDW4A TaxID=2714924 RepID=UPI00140D8D9E|nr:helix-turn-helix domain-containing protein [Diaphorobacter sp. HDW4A]QIL79694.1 helix-turn-helix domain-containing protein [Diaphorobacter sp. HDW4A]